MDAKMDACRVSEMEADLPRLVDRVKTGEQVLITRDGQPVAELRPIDKAGAMAALERLAELRSSLPPAPMSSVQFMDAMYEERRD